MNTRKLESFITPKKKTESVSYVELPRTFQFITPKNEEKILAIQEPSLRYAYLEHIAMRRIRDSINQTLVTGLLKQTKDGQEISD